MLRRIYARLKEQQKTAKLKETFKNLYSPAEDKEEIDKLWKEPKAVENG